MRKLCTVLLALALPLALSSAQEKRAWTLDECMRHALENNVSLKQKELSHEGREIDLADSRWAFAPSLSASSSASLSTGRVLDQTTYEFIGNSTMGSSSSSFSGSMELFGGFRKIYALKQAKLNLQAESAGLESAKDELRKSVLAAFLGLLCAEMNMDSAVKARELVESQIGRIEVLLDAGKITSTDLLQAKARLYAAENDCATAEGAVESARMELCQLLEIPDYAGFAIDGSGIAESPRGIISISEEDVLARPEFRQASLQVDAAKQSLNIARSAFYPSLSLSAGYGTSFSTAREKAIQNPDGTFRYEAYPFADQYLDNRNSYVSLSLNIPIFYSFSYRNNVRRQKLSLMDAEFNALNVKKALMKQSLQAEIDCRTAYKKYQSAQEQLRYAEEAERQIRERYDAGAADFDSWNVSATELARSRYALSEAKYSYLFKLKTLEMFLRR